MSLPFEGRTQCGVVLLAENTDPNGKHLEYRDRQGVVFARMAKVYKKGGLFGLFNADSNVHGELKDTAGNLLLTITSYRGTKETPRDYKVEINFPDGTLLGTQYDAHYGVDFESPDGRLLGRARCPEGTSSAAVEMVHTFTDASGNVLGTTDYKYPDKNDSVLDFLVHGTNFLGQPVDVFALEAPVAEPLQTMLFLFPSLQYLRFARHSYED